MSGQRMAAVDWANANEVIMGAPALWVADQLQAEGFRYVEVIDAPPALVSAEQWDALHRTFRWGMDLPIKTQPS